MAKKTALRKACVALRQNERLSIKAICAITGASKGAVSTWLREYPLSSAEIAARQSRAAKMSASKCRERMRVVASTFPALAALKRTYSPTTDQIGRAAELAVRARMALVGIEVFNPESDKAEVDVLCRRRGSSKLRKIQIRTATKTHHGNSNIYIRKKHGRTETKIMGAEDLDYLIGYNFDTDTAHVFTLQEVAGHVVAVSITKDSSERWDKIT